MIRRLTLAFAVFIWSAALLQAEEPLPEIELARGRFQRAIQHGMPPESARQHYLSALIPLRRKFVEAHRDKGWQAVDAEMKSHSMPASADPAEVRRLLAGVWRSPQFVRLYRRDGTWKMLSAHANHPYATHGHWRVAAGNCWLETAGDKPMESASRQSPHTLLLLTGRDCAFLINDGELVLYRQRLRGS